MMEELNDLIAVYFKIVLKVAVEKIIKAVLMRDQWYLNFVPLWGDGPLEAHKYRAEAHGAVEKSQICLCFSDKAMQERLIYSKHIHINRMQFFKIQIHSKGKISPVATATAEEKL